MIKWSQGAFALIKVSFRSIVYFLFRTCYVTTHCSRCWQYSNQIIRFRTEGPWRTLHSGSEIHSTQWILRSTASRSPGNSNLMRMPILGPEQAPTSSETLGVGAQQSNLTSCRMILMLRSTAESSPSPC